MIALGTVCGLETTALTMQRMSANDVLFIDHPAQRYLQFKIEQWTLTGEMILWL